MKPALFWLVILVACCLLPAPFLQARTLAVGNAVTSAGARVALAITVDDPADIGAAVFTVVYDSRYLQLTGVSSNFFATFANQWHALQSRAASQVTVDGTTYIQPLLQDTAAGHTRIAAVRVTPDPAADNTLFTLEFTTQAATPPGTYPVAILPTSLSTVQAGYPATGSSVPLLISKGPGYTPLAATIQNGQIEVGNSGGSGDSDGDGIADSWEMAYFGTLSACSHTSDHDQDGYSDFQEYRNVVDALSDPEGQPFNPLKANAPGGRGYHDPNRPPCILPPLAPLLLNGPRL